MSSPGSIVRPRVRARLLGILAATALLGWAIGVPAAARSASAPKPSTVVSASVSQSAQQIVWRVKLSVPFSPAQMKRDHRSLCLALERPGQANLTGQASLSGLLCVIPPRPGHASPRLVYEQVKRGTVGRARVVNATLRRPSTRELTASFQPSAYGSAAYDSFRWQVRTTVASPACTPVPPNAAGCVALFPARPQPARLHTPQLVGCVPAGPDYVTNGSRRVHELALTFDDGPWYDTPQFLDVLERYNVPATFFQIGEEVPVYGGRGGAVERRILADGDMIGDHTWNHADVSGGGGFAAGEISEAAHAIRAATGFTPCLFRAPGGAVSRGLEAEARSMGFTTIEWDVDPRDWATPGTASIYDTVTSTARNGSIILQHDGGGNRSETLAALPHEIETFKREGYRFVTVTQMLGQRLLYK
jgi:peptidoglycan/xylan/chitin deacetylase (PgdA/CDA1 family)